MERAVGVATVVAAVTGVFGLILAGLGIAVSLYPTESKEVLAHLPSQAQPTLNWAVSNRFLVVMLALNVVLVIAVGWLLMNRRRTSARPDLKGVRIDPTAVELQRHIGARRHLTGLDVIAGEFIMARKVQRDLRRENFVRQVVTEARAMILIDVPLEDRRIGFLECVDADNRPKPAVIGQPPTYDHLRLLSAPGIAPADIQDVKGLGTTKGLANRAILGGWPVEEPDVNSPAAKANGFVEPSHGVKIGAMLCVPVRLGDRVLGVMSADSPRTGAFHPTDKSTLIELANKVALAYAMVPPKGSGL